MIVIKTMHDCSPPMRADDYPMIDGDTVVAVWQCPDCRQWWKVWASGWHGRAERCLSVYAIWCAIVYGGRQR